ncbi:MAG: linear amide C-N hydrolase [Promethearchaeota archaeon]|nr:MAG: linear amide C-N hydrolase [Candidatus Lokiarchaeota archaeon]
MQKIHRNILKWGGLVLIVGVVFITGIVLIPRINPNSDDDSPDGPQLPYPENKIISLDRGSLYFLNLTTDYHFDTRLSTSLSPFIPILLNSSAFACTCVSITTSPNCSLFGRNFDWYPGNKLIIETHPPNAYRSISMVDVDALGLNFPTDFLSTSSTFYPTFAFSPFDGMNEQGLSVGCLVSPGMTPGYNKSKSTLNSLEFMRLALDYATSVSEVVDLWEKYNIDYLGGPNLHYMVGDALGNSAIIEWIDGEMVEIENIETWQVVTNFRISNASAADFNSCWRYTEAVNVLTSEYIVWNQEIMRDLLANVSVSGTQWSNVYDMAQRCASITIERQFQKHAWEFRL